MKKYYFICIGLCCILSLYSSAQSNFWLQSGGGSGNDEAYGLTARNNFIYQTGYYSEYGAFGDALLAAFGAGDIYVSRIAASGEYLWTKQFGGLLADRGICVATQSNGNVVFGGTVTGQISVGTQQLNTNQGSQDIVVGCLSPDGDVLWAQVFGGSDIDIISDIQTDSENNIIFCGQFRDSITLGANQYFSGLNLLNNQPSYDLLVVKLNANGQLLWSKQGKTSRDDQSMHLAISPENEIFLTGIFSDTLQFDNTYVNTSFGMGFLLKMDASGEELWFRRIWSNVTNFAGLAFYNNQVFLTGNFSGQQKFASNNLPFSGEGFNNSMPNKYYLAAYNTSGTLLWAKTEGSSNPVSVKGLTLGEQNQITIAGQFNCQHSQYSEAYGAGLFLSNGLSDIFVSAFDLNGNRLWAKQIGGKGADEVNDMATLANSFPIMAGSFEDKLAAPAKGTWNSKSWYIEPLSTNTYQVCNDDYYRTYARLQSLGNKDVFVASIADSTRRTLDLFDRPTNTCNFDMLPGEIQQEYSGAFGCSQFSLKVDLPFLFDDFFDLDLSYQWSSGAQTPTYQPLVSGSTSVSVNATTTCYSFQDTIAYTLPLITPLPVISTGYGSIVALDPLQVSCSLNLVVVAGDTALLNGNVVSSPFMSYWTLPDGQVVSSSSISVHTGGTYYYTIQNVDGSCGETVCIKIWISTYNNNICEGSSHPFVPQLYWGEVIADTISGCPNQEIELNLEDSTLHSLGLPTQILLFGRWTVLGPNLQAPLPVCLEPSNPYFTLGDHSKKFSIEETGPAVVRIELLLPPFNNEIFVTLDFPVFIQKFPQPEIDYSLSGLYENVCPRDTAFALFSSAVDTIIYPDNFLSLNTNSEPDFIQMLIEETYVIELRDTNDFGCAAMEVVELEMTYKSAPEISMNPENGVLCPGGFVELTCTEAQQIEWNGPNNDVISTELLYQAQAPGFYSALVTDAEGCVLVSNRVLLRQFLAPNFSLSKARMCLGDTIFVEADVSEGDSIQWLTPLSGSNPIQAISDTGTYTIQLYACNDTINASFTVEYSDVQANIEFDGDSLRCASDTVLLTGSSQSIVSHLWLPDQVINPQFEVYQAGTYILQVTDEHFCMAYDTVSIGFHPAVAPPLAIDTLSFCLSDSLLISAQANQPVYWFINDTLLASNATAIWYLDEYAGQPLSTAMYNDSTGCYSERVEVPLLIKPSIALPSFPDTSICQNDTLVFSILPSSLNVSNYAWQTPVGTITSDSTLVVFAADSSLSGNYTLIVSANENACGTDTATFNLLVHGVNPPELVLSAAHICTDQVFTVAVQGNMADSLSWTFQNQQFSGDSLSIIIDDSTTNNAQVFFQALNAAGCVVRDTLSLNVYPTPLSPEILSPWPCLNDTLFVSFGVNGPSSLQLTFESNVDFVMINSQLVYMPDSAEQVITLQAFVYSNHCVSDTSQMEWIVGAPPTFSLPDTLTYCLPDLLWVEGPPGFNFYQWSNGSNTVDTEIEVPGWYHLTVADEYQCEAVDSLYAFGDFCDAEPVPNVFTPNNDMYNDKFVISAHGMSILSATIFDRWGKRIAELSDVASGWDGKNLAGDEMPAGTYFYVAQAQYINQTMQELKGTVTLIR